MAGPTTQASAPTRDGSHDPATYAALLSMLARAERSGILEVHAGPRWRRVYLLDGAPIWYASNVESEALGSTLLAAGLVNRKQLSWISGKLSGGEKLEDALLASGVLDLDALHDHQRHLVERGYGAALGWSEGKWSFQSSDALRSETLDPDLRMAIPPHAALWEAVRQHVGVDAVSPWVSDESAGPLRPDDRLAADFPALAVDEPLQVLAEQLQQERAVEDLFRDVPDRTGDLVRLLWLLEVTGLVHRTRSAADDPTAAIGAWIDQRDVSWEEQVLQAQAPLEPAPVEDEIEDTVDDLLAGTGIEPETPPPATAARPSRPKAAGAPAKKRKKRKARRKRTPAELATLLQTALGHRMGKDYYGFLGVPNDAAAADIKRAYSRLLRRCKLALETDGLPEDGRDAARQLGGTAKKVYKTLSDDARRASYDRMLGDGVAPVAEPPIEESAPAAPTTPKAQPAVAERKPASAADEALLASRLAMKRGDYDRALAPLERARRDRPSDPDVLADLGWATWMARGKPHDDPDEAEEFLRLALTFQARHPLALERLARIAVDVGDDAEARKRIEALLRVQPASPWAHETLASLPDSDDDASTSAARFRFWKKKR